MGGSGAFGYQQPETVATYWRRRFITLAIGLVIFGLAAWGLSTVLAVSPRIAGPPAGTHHHRPGLSGKKPVAARSGPGSTSRATARTASGSPQADPARSRTTGHAAGHTIGHTGNHANGPATGQATGHGMILPAFCARDDIVLSLFTGQTAFGSGQWPGFSVNVVSTQQAECSFNIGSRHLALVIKEGPELIWSSADCAAGAGGLVAALKRGVPTVLAISWDRETSAPGCSGRTTRVPVGIYTAYAVDGQLASEPVTFRLT
jgi:hypothetical protein